MAAPVPAPSFVITRTEEWPEADFDLPEDQESFAFDNEGEPEADAGDLLSRLKGSRPSLSGAGAVAKLGGAPVEDEDWDAEFEDGPPKSSVSMSSAGGSIARFAGKITRLGSVEPEVERPVEDWSDDGDLELPEPERTNLTLARAPLPQSDTSELEDTGDVSTIKVAKLNFPSVAALSKSALGSKSTTAEDDDFEADFALPMDMANLSLKILTPQTSSLSLRHKSSTGVTDANAPWGEMTTSSSQYSDTSSVMSMYPPDASPSITSTSQPGTETDPSDADFGVYEEDEDEAFDGLVLPEGLSGRHLAKHLETKKKVVPAEIAAAHATKGSITSQSHRQPNEGEDFESGLLIGDDEDLSISRLRRRRDPDSYRSKSVPVARPASILRPSSRLRTESVLEVLASASNPPSITRSRSPNSTSSHRSLTRKGSRSSLVSPTFSSLRPSSLRSSSSSHASASTINLLTIPGSPSAPSSISPRTAPLKHQKSVGRLQLSPGPTAEFGGQRLPRKASLSSLASASAAISSSSGTPSTSSTISARSSGFNAPTAASKARHKSDREAEAEKKRSYAVPPTRPTTPSTNPIALRLTMPTSSSRQKIRPSITNVFPSPANPTSAQSFSDRGTSPLPHNPRRTPTSPHRVRTRSGNSTGATPSSSISSIASAAPSVKVLRKPKRAKTFGDGTELDAFDDLPEDREKERMYRVQPVGRGGVPRGEKGSAAGAAPAVASGGTIGRRSTATGTLRRPPSSTSSHGSTGESPLIVSRCVANSD
jgi:hypothetical protein